MHKLVFVLFVFLAVSAVAIADVLLKKAALAGSMGDAIKTPYFWLAVVLYVFQIFAYTYVFAGGMKLSLVGVLQTILYALVVLLCGFLLFKETLTMTQGIGMALGLVGVVLMNI